MNTIPGPAPKTIGEAAVLNMLHRRQQRQQPAVAAVKQGLRMPSRTTAKGRRQRAAMAARLQAKFRKSA